MALSRDVIPIGNELKILIVCAQQAVRKNIRRTRPNQEIGVQQANIIVVA
jgi:hypothetical protein